MKSYGFRPAVVFAIVAVLAPAAAQASEIAFTFVSEQQTVLIPVASGPKVAAISAPNDEPNFAVEIVVSPDIAAKVCEMTKSGVGRTISIMVGCTIVTQAIVQAPLCEGVFLISGGFTRTDAEALASRVRGGTPICDKPQS